AQFRVFPAQIQLDLLAPLRVGSVITDPRAAGWTLRSGKLRSASGHEEQCSQKEEIESHELCILSQKGTFSGNSGDAPRISSSSEIRGASPEFQRDYNTVMQIMLTMGMFSDLESSYRVYRDMCDMN